MESKVKALGHPIHPMLIVFPLGLLATAVIFDILYLIFANPNFPVIAYYLLAAGIIGGLASAVFGFADWLAIPPGTRARSVGLTHGIGNVVVVILFGLSWFVRRNLEGFEPNTLALTFSFAGALLSVITGWLGGELVYRLGVAVDHGAHLDAPSSLSDQPATAGSVSEAGRGYAGQASAIPATGRHEHLEDEDDDQEIN